MKLLWSSLDILRVPARPPGFWTLAQEYVPGNRLLRITVLREDGNHNSLPVAWNLTTESACGPDGLSSDVTMGARLCTNAAWGALIGKIGGSTGDLPDFTPGNAAPWGTKRVFASGWDCILTFGAADGGPLFLTMNDNPERFAQHSGELVIHLQHYPL